MRPLSWPAGLGGVVDTAVVALGRDRPGAGAAHRGVVRRWGHSPARGATAMWFLALHLLEIPGAPRCGRRRSGVRDQRSRV